MPLQFDASAKLILLPNRSAWENNTSNNISLNGLKNEVNNIFSGFFSILFNSVNQNIILCNDQNLVCFLLFLSKKKTLFSFFHKLKCNGFFFSLQTDGTFQTNNIFFALRTINDSFVIWQFVHVLYLFMKNITSTKLTLSAESSAIPIGCSILPDRQKNSIETENG